MRHNYAKMSDHLCTQDENALTLTLLVANFANEKWRKKTRKRTETLAHRWVLIWEYSARATLRWFFSFFASFNIGQICHQQHMASALEGLNKICLLLSSSYVKVSGHFINCEGAHQAAAPRLSFSWLVFPENTSQIYRVKNNTFGITL